MPTTLEHARLRAIVDSITRALRRHPERKAYDLGVHHSQIPSYMAKDHAAQAVAALADEHPDRAVYNWARSAASFGLDVLGREVQ